MSEQIECVLLVLLLFLHWIDHGRLLRAVIKSREPGISPSYHECALGYFHWKIEEKWNQNKSLAVWFPAYYMSCYIYPVSCNLSDNPAFYTGNFRGVINVPLIWEEGLNYDSPKNTTL